ncbi:CD3337/EF1877 family mobilome membrane protein (plasmid) [Paenibacillus sp. RS8]|uniref:CD3337/EF1877 family mobilome membrane protein n=1 Tax=Paenibacillus sp. RS8 TaxID=3242681 RepID=UPI0035BFAB29
MKIKASTLGFKKSKRLSIILGLVLVFFIVASIPASIIYANSLDTMVPSDTNKDALYNRYGVSHYSFQTVSEDHHFWQVSAAAKDSLVNAFDQMLSMCFLVSVQLTRFFNFLAREAFTFSFMDSLIDSVSDIIRNITGVNGAVITSGGLFDGLGGIAVMITVSYILWLMVRTRFLDGLQQSLSFFIALVICIAFFSQSGAFLKTANQMVSSVGTTMYKGLAKATGLNTNAENGVTVISEQVWNELVIRPYSMLQFDNTEISTKDPVLFDKVLTSKPFSGERDMALAEAADKYPGVGAARSAEQMIIILVYFIFSLFILGFFCFWAVMTIFMRLKLIVHAAVMSVTLLASLLPGREAGIAVIRSQFIKLIGYAVTTAMTMFFLDLSLVMGHVTYDVVAVKGGKGWFTGLLLESVIIFVIFKYREEINSVFSKATGVIPQIPKAKSTVVDAFQRNVTRTLYNTAANKVSGIFNSKEREGVPSTFNPSSLSKASTVLNDATSSSMMLRYQREKQAAESIATESGEEVQYTPYVQRVNENLRNGTKNPFRGMDKEWKEEKNRLKEIKDDGGDMKQAVLTQGVQESMNDQEVAATVYGNENAIRQAASHMVNRPKEAVNQMARVKSLNKNHKLQTSVNDFCMIQLFERYKVEYKRAIDTSQVTGNPVEHTDFVKNMDSRFKVAGLNTTQKVNETMMHRNSRTSIAPVFDEMPEFNEYKMKLLQANEALRKIAPPASGIYIPEPVVHFAAPVSTDFLVSQMPKLPTGNITSQMNDRKVALGQKIDPITNKNTKVVALPESYLSKQKHQKNAVDRQTKVTPLYKSAPISTESFRSSVPQIPGSAIASQMKERKGQLHQNIKQSLDSNVTHIKAKQDKVIIPPPSYIVGPVSQASVLTKLPKLPDSSVSSNLAKKQEVRRTIVDQTLIGGLDQKEQSKPITLKRRQVTQQMEIKRLFTGRIQADSKLSEDTYSIMPSRLRAKYRVNVSSSVEGNVGKTPAALANMTTTTSAQLSQLHKVRVQRKFGTQLEVGRMNVRPADLVANLQQAKSAVLPLQAISSVASQSVQQTLLNKVNIKRRSGTQIDMQQVNIKNPELKAKMEQGAEALAPFRSTRKTSLQSVQQNMLHKVNLNRNSGTKVEVGRVNVQQSDLKARMQQARTTILPLQSTNDVAQQSVQQRSLNKVNIKRYKGTQVHAETVNVRQSGTGMEPSKRTSIPIQSTNNVSQQSVQQRSLNKVNIKRSKDVQVDMKQVKIKNPDLKATLEQAKSTILPLQSTSNVSEQSLRQRRMHKVRIDQRSGVHVEIKKQEQHANTKVSESVTLPKVNSSTRTVEQEVVQNVRVNRKVTPKLDIKTVNIKNSTLKTKMEEAKTALNRSGPVEDLKIQINTEQVQKVAMEVKQKISPNISSGLEDELRHLKTMQRARKTAPVTQAAESLSQSVQQKARIARQTPQQKPGKPS